MNSGFATADLGLGNYGANQLSSQVAGETDEQRKRRLAQLAQQRMVGQSPATVALFGSRGGIPGGFGVGAA